ncbi:MAG TPA: nucleotide-binding domain containing protein, partial [Ilumatobacteraceae bacterium]|nr:nucleotide-binding domain containing protein [Ilumatobacteraceae bacterium]
DPPVRWLVIDAQAIHDMDVTAAQRFAEPSAPIGLARPGCQRVIIVAGSQHEVTKRQLAALDRTVTVLRIDPRDQSFLDQAKVTIEAADGLILTGGHTARSVLSTGARRLDIGGEVETGIPWAVTTANGRDLAVITKAGGFGDDGALMRAVRFLTTAQSAT